VPVAPKFSNLSLVDEIWIGDTTALASDQWVSFALIDRCGLVELLTFESSDFKTRRDDRPDLGSPWREF
jgi:hypothetical protein